MASKPKTPPPVLVVIQQGGSTQELYVHTFDTVKEVKAYRRSAQRASYRTSPEFEVPRALADTPGFCDALQSAMEAAGELVCG